MKTVHFRVGADFGITLMQIANEHLLYGNDLDKALRVFTDSLGGEVPQELVKQLLSGEQIILVDEENQMFNVVKRKKYPHLDNIYPAQIDFNAFVIDKQKELDDHCNDLEHSLDFILDKFRYRTTYSLDISVESLMKYIYGKEDEFIADLMDGFEYDDNIQQMKSLIRITRDFIEKSLGLSQMIKRLNGMYDIRIKFDTQNLLNLTQKIQDIAKVEFYTFKEGNDEILTSYLDATKEIDEVLKAGIKPVDIMDNYTAGWLSPDGDYYALNGLIGNMLHLQIANALQVKGLIPEKDKYGTDQNPDAWLEEQGWVKIHENNINFGGCLNDKLGKINVNMTKKQIELIRDYITDNHACIIKAGWKLEKTSIDMFTAMALRDPLTLNKKYFLFFN